VQADIGLALQQLLPLIKQNNRHHWLARVNHIRANYALPPIQAYALPPIQANAHHPQGIMQWLSCNLEQDAIIATDVGQHQMWTAQYFPVMRPRTLLTSGGLGTMGFGLPTALGAALAFPDRTIICISGDGSILMNLQELSTLAELQARVKIILLNNNQLGLVRQQQEFFYDSRFIASCYQATPDFCAIARGFGIEALAMEDTPEAPKRLKELLEAPGPAFINLPISQHHTVVPMVPPGAANHQMIGG
jgi:acetolactate synthase-1/2/3 large subunit